MSADLPEAAITAAAEALWQSGACEPREAAAIARIALTAAQAALTESITRRATEQERERWLAALTELRQVIVYGNTRLTRIRVIDLLDDLLGGTADGAHTPGGAT